MDTRAERIASTNFLDEEDPVSSDPPTVPPPPLPPILHGWAELGLLDPRRDGRLRIDGSTADVLAFASMPSGAEDPVEGLLEGVRTIAAGQAAMFAWVDRTIQAAFLLRRRIDDRAPKVQSMEEREADDRVAATPASAGRRLASEPPTANE